MIDEYDFSKGRRGPVKPLPPGKKRMFITLEEELVNWFIRQVPPTGGDFQVYINDALREYIARHEEKEAQPK